MSSFFMRGDRPFANYVEAKRCARKLQRHLKEEFGLSITMDQALDAVAKMLGAKHFHDLLSQASDPDISGWETSTVQKHVWQQAVTRGMPFPKKLPAAFREHWQRNALELFKEAELARKPGELEFIALVGADGTGKTLLANHVCADRGGRVIDVGLAISRGSEFHYDPGAVLVYDQPAQPPASNQPAKGGAPSKQTLKMYRELHRVRHNLIPHDVDAFNSIREWVKNNPQVPFVVCFASLAEVEEALRRSPIMMSPGGMQRSASQNWRRAHVVDLDNMTSVSLNGPGLEMEQGRYVQGQ